jgi:hypothetical protein
MKINTAMPQALKPFYQKELKAYQEALKKKYYQVSWRHLERAHILGQPYPYQHSYVHWKMLLFGIRIKDLKEVFGQVPRLIVGGVKSFVGTIPVGNTGGANVPPLRPMEIPEDLADIIHNSTLPH